MPNSGFRLALGVMVGSRRITWLLRLLWLLWPIGRVGIGDNAHAKHRRRPDSATHEDPVQRWFVADAPNRLWCTDVTGHPTATGKIWCCPESRAVLDVFSRTIVG